MLAVRSVSFSRHLQEKMKSWSKQLEELSSQVAQLKMEKGELETRNRILESSLIQNTHHEERLHCNEVHPLLAPAASRLACTSGLEASFTRDTIDEGWQSLQRGRKAYA